MPQKRASKFTVLPGDGSKAIFRKVCAFEKEYDGNFPLVSTTLSKTVRFRKF